MVSGVERRHHDVAALHKTHLPPRLRAEHIVQHVGDPRPGRIDDRLWPECTSARAIRPIEALAPKASSFRAAATTFVRVMMVAPRSAASSAVSTTSLLSSTQQSE